MWSCQKPSPLVRSEQPAAHGQKSIESKSPGQREVRSPEPNPSISASSMALPALCCFTLQLWSILFCAYAQQQEDSLYMWIDAHQARVLIGFEEDILIVSEGKMAPFTHDFRKAQQRMPAIPVNIQAMNFTWKATGQAEYFYEFLSLRSLDKAIMADPTVNIPLLGTVPHKTSVVQIGFPCLGNQDGVAAFEVNIIVMNTEGNVILQTPQNAIFFKTCQQAKCPGGCRNGGFCNERHVCECPDGFYGPHCEKALCMPRCLNGGLCVTPGLCICPPGYYGTSCDKANCTTTCLNGGTCFYPGKCICPSGFEGDQCETSKCQQPCRNGGKCSGKNKCKCSKGYQGDLCSKPVCEPSCGSHGTCIEPNKCQCKEGWNGRHCNKRYGGNIMNAMRPTGTKNRQHTPSPKRTEDKHVPHESNYIW